MGLLDTITAPAARHGSPPGAAHRTPWEYAATRSPGARTGLAGLLPRPGRARGQAGPVALRRLRRIVRRWRFALAAALFGLAVALTVHVLRPPPPPTVDVAVTARPVSAGTELTRDDLVLRTIATDLVPPGALHTVRDLLGRAAVVALPAGAPLHATLVSDASVSAAAPRGTVVVPVRLSDDAVAALLRPGDRVDLLSGTTSATGQAGVPQYLARAALVLPVPAGREPESAGGLLGPASEADRPVTLVAVDPEDAPELSAVSGWGSVTAVLVP